MMKDDRDSLVYIYISKGRVDIILSRNVIQNVISAN